MNLEKSTPELFAAIAAAQGEVENATKNAQNPHFKSRYADLAEVLNTVRPVFAAHKLAITQSTEYDGTLVSVTTCIGHASNGYITNTAACVPAKSDAQAIGSASTYLRRYSLAAMAGVAQEDDDGNAAQHNRPAPRRDDLSKRIAGTPQDAAPLISADDVATIADLCRSTKTDTADFAKWLGFSDLASVPASHFARAKRGLEAKAEKMRTATGEVIAGGES